MPLWSRSKLERIFLCWQVLARQRLENKFEFLPYFLFLVDAVDSRLVFNGTRVPSYIELSSKTFPRVSELTISFWVRFWPKSDGSQHTIIFYRTGIFK